MKSRFASMSAWMSAWVLLPLFASCLGAGSGWKVQGGPQACVQMCAGWGLEFAGMVGVGNQDAWGDGATACVCQVRGASRITPQAAATAASLAAPIARAAEDKRRREAEDQKEQEDKARKDREEQEEKEKRKQD